MERMHQLRCILFFCIYSSTSPCREGSPVPDVRRHYHTGKLYGIKNGASPVGIAPVKVYTILSVWGSLSRW